MQSRSDCGPVTPEGMRGTLGKFSSGVLVLSYLDDGTERGITVNAFTSVSLSPPLILVSLDKRSLASSRLTSIGFTVNILASDQRSEALHFAGSPQLEKTGRFEAWGSGIRLPNCIGYLDCSPTHSFEAGDHLVVVCDVLGIETVGLGAPLVFYSGAFWNLGAAHDSLSRTILADGFDVYNSSPMSWA